MGPDAMILVFGMLSFKPAFYSHLSPSSSDSLGFLGGSYGKESACNVGDPGSIPGLGRFPWEEVKWSEVAQLCPTLCNPMDCSPPASSVHGIFQARILEWVAISFCSRSSQPSDWTWASCIVGRCFTIWATREVLQYPYLENPMDGTWQAYNPWGHKDLDMSETPCSVLRDY